jgi:hypothetical protein
MKGRSEEEGGRSEEEGDRSEKIGDNTLFSSSKSENELEIPC